MGLSVRGGVQTPGLQSTALKFLPCVVVVKCLHELCQNYHPLLFSAFFHAFLKEHICLWLGFPMPQEGES